MDFQFKEKVFWPVGISEWLPVRKTAWQSTNTNLWNLLCVFLSLDGGDNLCYRLSDEEGVCVERISCVMKRLKQQQDHVTEQQSDEESFIQQCLTEETQVETTLSAAVRDQLHCHIHHQPCVPLDVTETITVRLLHVFCSTRNHLLHLEPGSSEPKALSPVFDSITGHWHYESSAGAFKKLNWILHFRLQSGCWELYLFHWD